MIKTNSTSRLRFFVTIFCLVIACDISSFAMGPKSEDKKKNQKLSNQGGRFVHFAPGSDSSQHIRQEGSGVVEKPTDPAISQIGNKGQKVPGQGGRASAVPTDKTTMALLKEGLEPYQKRLNQKKDKSSRLFNSPKGKSQGKIGTPTRVVPPVVSSATEQKILEESIEGGTAAVEAVEGSSILPTLKEAAREALTRESFCQKLQRDINAMEAAEPPYQDIQKNTLNNKLEDLLLKIAKAIQEKYQPSLDSSNSRDGDREIKSLDFGKMENLSDFISRDRVSDKSYFVELSSLEADAAFYDYIKRHIDGARKALNGDEEKTVLDGHEEETVTTDDSEGLPEIAANLHQQALALAILYGKYQGDLAVLSKELNESSLRDPAVFYNSLEKRLSESFEEGANQSSSLPSDLATQLKAEEVTDMETVVELNQDTLEQQQDQNQDALYKKCVVQLSAFFEKKAEQIFSLTNDSAAGSGAENETSMKNLLEVEAERTKQQEDSLRLGTSAVTNQRQTSQQILTPVLRNCLIGSVTVAVAVLAYEWYLHSLQAQSQSTST